MDRETVLSAIKKYCQSNTSRQRKELYEYLNDKLGLSLSVYDYDGTNDHARFACDVRSQEWETDYVMKKFAE